MKLLHKNVSSVDCWLIFKGEDQDGKPSQIARLLITFSTGNYAGKGALICTRGNQEAIFSKVGGCNTTGGFCKVSYLAESIFNQLEPDQWHSFGGFNAIEQKLKEYFDADFIVKV